MIFLLAAVALIVTTAAGWLPISMGLAVGLAAVLCMPMVALIGAAWVVSRGVWR